MKTTVVNAPAALTPPPVVKSTQGLPVQTSVCAGVPATNHPPMAMMSSRLLKTHLVVVDSRDVLETVLHAV